MDPRNPRPPSLPWVPIGGSGWKVGAHLRHSAPKGGTGSLGGRDPPQEAVVRGAYGWAETSVGREMPDPHSGADFEGDGLGRVWVGIGECVGTEGLKAEAPRGRPPGPSPPSLRPLPATSSPFPSSPPSPSSPPASPPHLPLPSSHSVGWAVLHPRPCSLGLSRGPEHAHSDDACAFIAGHFYDHRGRSCPGEGDLGETAWNSLRANGLQRAAPGSPTTAAPGRDCRPGPSEVEAGGCGPRSPSSQDGHGHLPKILHGPHPAGRDPQRP